MLPELMNIFHFVVRLYNLGSNFTIGRIRDYNESLESFSFLAPKLWCLLANSILCLLINLKPRLTVVQLTTIIADYVKICWERRIQSRCSTGFCVFTLLSSFSLIICISSISSQNQSRFQRLQRVFFWLLLVIFCNNTYYCFYAKVKLIDHITYHSAGVEYPYLKITSVSAVFKLLKYISCAEPQRDMLSSIFLCFAKKMRF